MEWKRYLEDQVHRHYWQHGHNCAYTTLAIGSELFSIPVASQVMDAASGMWGAGGHGAQCGLVEGALMFIGLLGGRHGLHRDQISELCRNYARDFESRFGSLICRELRPDGFSADNPPHICEDLSKRAIVFTTRFVVDAFQIEPQPPSTKNSE